MSELVEGILAQLGQDGLSEIAKGVGVDEATVRAAVSAALPAIIAGMAGNTRDEQGAASLSNALDDHNDSIFGDLGSLIAAGGAGDGAKILGHVLGQQRPAVEENLAQRSGVGIDLMMKLLPILAPLVMGYLSGQKRSQGLDAGSLSSVLGQERRQVERQQPGLGGLAAILDDVIEGLGGR